MFIKFGMYMCYATARLPASPTVICYNC